MIEHVLDVTYAAPARLAPAPETEYIAQAHVAPSYPHIATGLMNPKFSTLVVEASASQIVCSFTTVNESAPGSFSVRNGASLKTLYTGPSPRSMSSLWKVSRRSIRNVFLSDLRSSLRTLLFLKDSSLPKTRP